MGSYGTEAWRKRKGEMEKKEDEAVLGSYR